MRMLRGTWAQFWRCKRRQLARLSNPQHVGRGLTSRSMWMSETMFPRDFGIVIGGLAILTMARYRVLSWVD